jgi:maltose O-acetyltransferase
MMDAGVGKLSARFAERVLRAAHSEVGHLTAAPLQALMQVAAAPLPQLSFNRTRTALLRAGGLKIGRGSQIMGPVVITGEGLWSELFEIGEHTYVTGPLRVDLAERVTIGDSVNIGHSVTLLTVDHEIGPSDRRCGFRESGPIVIQRGVWIAANATILPGVTVGEASVVAAGALVTRDVPPNTLVAGVPARVIRHLPPEGLVGGRQRRTERYTEPPITRRSGAAPESYLSATSNTVMEYGGKSLSSEPPG